MKKFLIILSLLFFSTDSFASGIASNTNSAPCTNNTLETYSGNSNLSADWQPNEIQLRWYNNNTLMTVQTSANTCVYDGTLTIPTTAPTRTGYTFDGWTVLPEMDFRTISDSTGLERWGKGEDLNTHTSTCFHSVGFTSATIESCGSDSHFVELEQQEWITSFEHGNLYGMSKCSAKGGDSHSSQWNGNSADWMEFDTNALDNAGGVKRYCWCKVTGYKAINQTVKKGSALTLAWIYAYDTGGDCSPGCAASCAYRVMAYSSFRTALFTPVSN